MYKCAGCLKIDARKWWGLRVWRHVGVIAVALGVSGCGSAPQLSPEVASANASINAIDGAADSSCPLTAPRIHEAATLTREAIALNISDLVQSDMTLLADASVMCKEERDNPQRYAFDPAAIEKLRRPGSGSLTGEAFLRQRGGGVVTCAGQPVFLMADTPYVNLASAPLAIPGAALAPDVVQHLAEATIQTTTCDAQGHFTFKNLTPGNYRVQSTVQWMAGDEPQGGLIYKAVSITSGPNEVIVSE